MPWGTAEFFDNMTVRPPWSHAVAFTSASSYIHLTHGTLRTQLLADDRYWLDKQFPGSLQLMPYTRHHVSIGLQFLVPFTSFEIVHLNQALISLQVLQNSETLTPHSRRDWHKCVRFHTFELVK
jgi:hypothetical protein